MAWVRGEGNCGAGGESEGTDKGARASCLGTESAATELR